MIRFTIQKRVFSQTVLPASTRNTFFKKCFPTTQWARSSPLFTSRRLTSTTVAAPKIFQAGEPIPATNASVANWLYVCAAVVAGVVWFGGVTRLTDSGLSIVEWKPLRGIRPPLNQKEWEDEFNNYKRFPEHQQRSDMTLTEFKFIFFWEWAHRVLARSVGVVFGVPLLYYMYKGRFAGNRPLLLSLWGILSLGGAQGFMGWYMVSSGLDHSLIEERKKVTVSSYRLASHLFLAFLIYAAMLRVGYGLKLPKCPQFPGFKKVQLWSRASCSVMFLTAMSGAFVAGLDAGLMYNDGFPLMAGGIIPPMDHLTALEPWWRNFFENHAAAQTTHRLLAGVTFLTIAVLNSAVHRGKVTPQVMRTLHAVNGALILQVLLGMWTVISQVDIPVAASHQFGALLLLSTLIRMCAVVGSRGVVLA